MNERPIDFSVGDRVTIREGVFSRFDATVIETDTTTRVVHLSISIFGRETPIRFDSLVSPGLSHIMTTTVQDREKMAATSLATATDWRNKGHPRWELTCLSSSLMNFLGVAVERYPNAASGAAYLAAQNVGAILNRAAELDQQLHLSLQRDGQPTAGAVNNDVTLVHIAWLVEQWPAADALLEICLDPLVRKYFPLPTFWVEYSRAIECLRDKRQYEPAFSKARGYEQYWVPYLSLISDLTNSRDSSTSRQEIKVAFQKRNLDKRLTDWRMIDGDGKHPVQWDFREFSILRFAEASH